MQHTLFVVVRDDKFIIDISPTLLYLDLDDLSKGDIVYKVVTNNSNEIDEFYNIFYKQTGLDRNYLPGVQKIHIVDLVKKIKKKYGNRNIALWKDI